VPTLFAVTAKRFRKYLKENLSETEIFVVSQVSFCHFLFNRWDGEPSKSRSCGWRLYYGLVSFVMLPGQDLADEDIKVFRRYAGLGYPVSVDFLDYNVKVANCAARDCGILTEYKVRYAQIQVRNQWKNDYRAGNRSQGA
jgi:hypothetical protein